MSVWFWIKAGLLLIVIAQEIEERRVVRTTREHRRKYA